MAIIGTAMSGERFEFVKSVSPSDFAAPRPKVRKRDSATLYRTSSFFAQLRTVIVVGKGLTRNVLFVRDNGGVLRNKTGFFIIEIKRIL